MGSRSCLLHRFGGSHLHPWEGKHDWTILGAPLNYPSPLTQSKLVWGKATQHLHETLGRITEALDTQSAHHLLRKCMDACKVTHLLRSTDPHSTSEEVEECTEAIILCFEDIVGTGFTREGNGCKHACPCEQGVVGYELPHWCAPQQGWQRLFNFTKGE